MSAEELVERWCQEDHRRALLPADHEAIEATRTMRALLVSGIRGAIDARDLLHACWRLGNLLAVRGGSPTLLGATLDGARVAEPETCRSGFDHAPDEPETCRSGFDHAPDEPETCRPDWVGMRAALCEGYAAARGDMVRAEAMRAWDYPACVVPIDAETIAVACGIPDDDADLRVTWADRVASAAARAGVRRAYVSGRERAVNALVDALTVVGIERVPSAGAAQQRRSWLPWKRSQR